jgi:glycosyltransferase involved in cell wall biosynthesis
VVIPTYQEARNIGDVLARVRRALPDADVLVVDDGSPDGTAELAEAAGAALGGIEVLRRPGKDGLGRAYQDGYRRGLDAGYDLLVQMDADLSHDPGALPDLVAPVLAGEADVAIGSRYVPGASIPDWGWRRRALSRWGNRYTGAMLRLGVRDATAGFRAYRSEVLTAIDLDHVRAGGYGFQIEMADRAWRAGARIVEIPITFTDRTEGSSKMDGSIVVEAMALVTWWGVARRLRGTQPRQALPSLER